MTVYECDRSCTFKAACGKIKLISVSHLNLQRAFYYIPFNYIFLENQLNTVQFWLLVIPALVLKRAPLQTTQVCAVGVDKHRATYVPSVTLRTDELALYRMDNFHVIYTT
jgi:hypothetical protein